MLQSLRQIKKFIALASFAAALIFLGASCAPAGTPQTTPPTKEEVPQSEQQGMMEKEEEGSVSASKKVVVALAAQNNSGQSGMVTLTEISEGKVYVEVTMEGVPSSVARPVHIHKGSCPKPGEVTFPLTNIEDERSESTLSTMLAELANMMPLAVNVHKSFADLSIDTACGDFPAEEMKAMMKTETGAVMQNKIACLF